MIVTDSQITEYVQIFKYLGKMISNIRVADMGIKTINFYKINGIIIGHFGKNMSENIQL
jgi:hypothetical protein